MTLHHIDVVAVGNAIVDIFGQCDDSFLVANKIEKQETRINWADKAKKILAKINAFYPSPGSWFDYKGARFKVNKAIEVQAKGRPGEILDNKLTIACAENAIRTLRKARNILLIWVPFIQKLPKVILFACRSKTYAGMQFVICP